MTLGKIMQRMVRLGADAENLAQQISGEPALKDAEMALSFVSANMRTTLAGVQRLRLPSEALNASARNSYPLWNTNDKSTTIVKKFTMHRS